ncbi:hypothetical protein ANO11243_084610 [Dothideomycetidae sp. 11243]|nr:hypothetical protein ANO11243_084610 [fungal sp. No.11243]
MAAPRPWQCLRGWDINTLRHSSRAIDKPPLRRWQSTIAAPSGKIETLAAAASKPSPLSRLPTAAIIRTLVLGSIMTFPTLYRMGMSLFSRAANSRSPLLDADKNFLLRWLVRPLIYDQFCAGTTLSEVRKTIAGLRKMGYSGVILNYGKEILLHDPKDASSSNIASKETESSSDTERQIEQWRDGNLETLKCISAGDFLAIKYTGAGPGILAALADGREPPQAMINALDALCEQAAVQGSFIWVDAEQQALQSTIDAWTIQLMRRYNRSGVALVSNTVQAYLKSSRDTIKHQLQLAQAEGWTLGLKLVRGAYLGREIRDRIHDTKHATDECYNGIVQDLLRQTWPGLDSPLPAVQLFIAGHNAVSIRKACETLRELAEHGKTHPSVRFGQLQGMADDVSCELLAMGERERARAAAKDNSNAGVVRAGAAPAVYKCLTWGSVQECMQFLVRRATENRGATDRMRACFPEMRAELRRRMPF